MKVFLCIDKSGGMLFNNRRLSSDSAVCNEILKICNGAPLLMNEYSAKLFIDKDNIIVNNDFLSIAKDDDYCFVESYAIPENVSEYYVFNWNRNYPYDFSININFKAIGYKKIESYSFCGSSHKKITLEVYKK